MRLPRRQFLKLAGSGLLLPHARASMASSQHRFRIRTITAGMELDKIDNPRRIHGVIDLLGRLRAAYQDKGYTVQTLRLATQSLAGYLPDWMQASSISELKKLDLIMQETGVLLSVGPLPIDAGNSLELGSWASKMIGATSRTVFSINVASADAGIHADSIRSAVEVIAALSRVGSAGLSNFRFTASACVPPGTPFFPATYHEGEDAFSIGLETPNLLTDTFTEADDIREAKALLRTDLQNALEPIEELGVRLARENGLKYGGIDVSPAPGPEASIGRAVETLTGNPFGSASTLAACSAITDVLKSLSVKKCGFSGLMLPVIEDSVLAARATENRYGISELLLYSSVCGTGLDVVPLPGDVSRRKLAGILRDVAALALKYNKPLSARIMPIPGKKAGHAVTFSHPLLHDSVVFAPD